MFFYIVLTPISTTPGLCSTGNMRKYQQIDIYIYQCDADALHTHFIGFCHVMAHYVPPPPMEGSCSIIKLCLFYNLITVRDISAKLHTFVKHFQTTCHAQES